MIFDHSKEMDQLTNKEKTALSEALIQEVVIRGGCDLHIHTHASDGADSAARVVQKAIENKLKCFAVTDHDSIEGVMDVIRILHKLKSIGLVCPLFIPGIELSIHVDEEGRYGKEVHILGYFPLGGFENIQNFLKMQRVRRNERNAKMCELLTASGLDISIDELRAEGGSVVGRLHAANILVRKGYVGSVKEAFSEWIGNGKSCYAKRLKPTAKEAIDCIREAGGVAVVAHPYLYGWTSGQSYVSSVLINRIKSLADNGLSGVEAFHGEASFIQKLETQACAKTLGLICTAGSDYHGDNKKGLKMYDGETKFFHNNEITYVAAIMETENAFLVKKKTEGINVGKWHFPSVQMIINENNEDILKKTLSETIGIKIYDIKHYSTSFYETSEQRLTFITYKCTGENASLEKVLLNNESYKLFSLKELSLLPLMNPDASCVDKLREISLIL